MWTLYYFFAVCLAQFATSYVGCCLPKKAEFVDDVSIEMGEIKNFGNDQRLPKYIRLSNDKYMRLRTYPAVLRMHSAKKKDGFEEQYAELMLYLPWRDEIVDLHRFDENGCLGLYYSTKATHLNNKRKMLPYSTMLREIEHLLELEADLVRPTNVSDLLDPTFQQENYDDLDECEPMDTTNYPCEEDMQQKSSRESTKFKQIILDDDDTMRSEARCLSFEQRIVFNNFINYCKDILVQQPDSGKILEPPRMIAHGNSS